MNDIRLTSFRDQPIQRVATVEDLHRLDPTTSATVTLAPTNQADELIESFVSQSERWTALQGIVVEALAESSWLTPDHLMAILGTFTWLDEFAVCAKRPTLCRLRHSGLRRLRIRVEVLSTESLLDVLHSDLLALEELELWPGEDPLKRTWSVAELQPLITGEVFPHLRRLKLGPCEEELRQVEATFAAEVDSSRECNEVNQSRACNEVE